MQREMVAWVISPQSTRDFTVKSMTQGLELSKSGKRSGLRAG